MALMSRQSGLLCLLEPSSVETRYVFLLLLRTCSLLAPSVLALSSYHPLNSKGLDISPLSQRNIYVCVLWSYTAVFWVTPTSNGSRSAHELQLYSLLNSKLILRPKI